MSNPSKKPTEKLSGRTLSLWRERMGFSRPDACQQLGCSASDWAAWEDGDRVVPRHIGLACAALALGMNPYGELVPGGDAS